MATIFRTSRALRGKIKDINNVYTRNANNRITSVARTDGSSITIDRDGEERIIGITQTSKVQPLVYDLFRDSGNDYLLLSAKILNNL